MLFIFVYLRKNKTMTTDTNKQYWLYAPGEKAKLWDDCYNEGIMAIGWDEIGDLSQFTDSNELKVSLR